jgi:hypothetical protein
MTDQRCLTSAIARRQTIQNCQTSPVDFHPYITITHRFDWEYLTVLTCHDAVRTYAR